MKVSGKKMSTCAAPIILMSSILLIACSSDSRPNKPGSTDVVVGTESIADTTLSNESGPPMQQEDAVINQMAVIEQESVAIPISVNPDTGDIDSGGGEFALRNQYGLSLSGDGQYAFYARSEDNAFVAAGASTTVYRYRLSDGHIDHVIDNRNRTQQDMLDISHNGEFVLYSYDQKTYLASSLNNFTGVAVDELVGGTGKVTQARFSVNGTMLVFQSAAQDDTGADVNSFYFYNLESETFEQVTQASIPSPTNLFQEFNWTPETIIDVNSDGSVVLLHADVQPLQEGVGSDLDPQRTRAFMVYNHTENTSHAITKFQLNPFSNPGVSGFFTPSPKPLLSATGDVVVYQALSGTDDQNAVRQMELFRFDYVNDAAPVKIEVATEPHYLSIDAQANLIAWKTGFVHSAYNVDNDELILLTDTGYSHCGRACARGQNEYLGPRVSADGKRIVFVEYNRADDEDWSLDSSLVKTLDVDSGAITVALNPINDRSSKALVVSDFDISDDGKTLVFESVFHGLDDASRQSVVLLKK